MPGVKDGLGRFLYLLPPPPLRYRSMQSNPVPTEVCDAYAGRIPAMLDWEPATDDHGDARPHLLHLSNEAYSEWHDFTQSIEVRMQPGREFEHFTDWAGKAPGAAARVAGVLHGIKHAYGKPWDAAITGETVTAALELMAAITHRSLAALDMTGADPTIAAAGNGTACSFPARRLAGSGQVAERYWRRSAFALDLVESNRVVLTYRYRRAGEN